MAFDVTTPDPDAELLARYAAGDRTAAQTLTRRLTPGVLALARRQLQDAAEAEDVAQEAMMRLWKIAPDWQPGQARVSTWLYRVAFNLCTDRQRRQRPDALPPDWDGASDQPPEVERIQQKSRVAALDAALTDLPERQRQAVVLRHLDGLANPEIAEIMAVSVEAVESLAARGKRALARCLGGRRQELGFADD